MRQSPNKYHLLPSPLPARFLLSGRPATKIFSSHQRVALSTPEFSVWPLGGGNEVFWGSWVPRMPACIPDGSMVFCHFSCSSWLLSMCVVVVVVVFKDFFNVDYLQSLYWICYNIACFMFCFFHLRGIWDLSTIYVLPASKSEIWTARKVPPCMLLFALMGFGCSCLCIFLCLAFLSSFLHISGLDCCTSQHCASCCPYPSCLYRLLAPPETQWVQPWAFCMFSSVQSLSRVGLFATPWAAAC